MEKQTQNRQVLAWLKSGQSLTSFQAFSYWGIQRLSARIQDLEKLGHVIDAPLEFEGSRHWCIYRLHVNKNDSK